MALFAGQVVEQASERIGEKIPRYKFEYARVRGYVTALEQRPDGYHVFDQSAVDQLVDYIRTRSRKPSSRQRLAGK